MEAVYEFEAFSVGDRGFGVFIFPSATGMKIKFIILPCFSVISLLQCQTVKDGSVVDSFDKKNDSIILMKDDAITIGEQEKELLIDKSEKSGILVKQSNGEIVPKETFDQGARLENLLIGIQYCLFDTYNEAYAEAKSTAEESSIVFTKGLCNKTDKHTQLWSDFWCSDAISGLKYLIVDGTFYLFIQILPNQSTPFEEKQAILLELIKKILDRKHASFE